MSFTYGSFTWPPVAGSGGGGGGVNTYANLAAFPSAVSAGNGALAIALDTNIEYESNGTSWLAIGSPTTVLAVGAVGSSPNADAASISSNTLTLQPADGTHPGLVTIGSQTLAGAKTFSTAPILSSLTASEALVLDGSKNIASLTYTNVVAGSTLVSRDSNGNSNFNNIGILTTTVVSSGTPVIMTYGSSGQQTITGSSNQTFNMPDATYLILGQYYKFNNNSTGTVTINDWSGSLLGTVPAGGYTEVNCTSNSTQTGSWDIHASLAHTSSAGTAGLSIPGTFAATSTVQGTQLISTISTGTAPLTVSSTTPVANLVVANINATSNSTLTTLSELALPASQLTSTGTLSDVGTDGITVTGGSGSTVSNVSLSQHVADASHNGYLSSTDWTTFNSKGSGTVTAVSIASSNGFTGTSSGGATPALTLTGTLTGDVTGTINSNSLTATTNSTLTTLSSLSLPLSQTTGVATIAQGGTDNGSLPVTAGGVIYTDGTKLQNVGAGTSGSALISQGSSAPVWSSGTSLGYAQAYCSGNGIWSCNSSGFGDFTLVSGSNAITVRQSSGITLTAESLSGNSLPAVVFTPSSASAVYLVTVTIGAYATTSNYGAFQLTDGTTTIALNPGIYVAGVGGAVLAGISLTGIYIPGTTSPVTLKVQASTNGTIEIDNTISSPTMEWTITQQPQNIISTVSYSLIGAMVTYGIYS